MRIEELINAIPQRPKMYLTGKRLDYLQNFLLGYCGANAGHAEDARLHNLTFPEDDMDYQFNGWFSKWLIQWIDENVDAEYVPESVLWLDNIRAIAKEDQDEFDLFFELCNLFFDDYRNKTGYFSWRNE